MVKTTHSVLIDSELWQSAKIHCAKHDLYISGLIEDLLRKVLRKDLLTIPIVLTPAANDLSAQQSVAEDHESAKLPEIKVIKPAVIIEPDPVPLPVPFPPLPPPKPLSDVLTDIGNRLEPELIISEDIAHDSS